MSYPAVRRVRTRRDWRTALAWLLTAITAAALGYDAYTHADLAATYDAVKTSALSQGDLFRVEAAGAAAAAALVALRPRRYTAAIAALVAAGGLAALLLYRYRDIGQVGPLPAMYEPAWYPEKTYTAAAQAVATGAALALLAQLHVTKRRDGRRSP